MSPSLINSETLCSLFIERDNVYASPPRGNIKYVPKMVFFQSTNVRQPEPGKGEGIENMAERGGKEKTEGKEGEIFLFERKKKGG